LGVAEKAGVAAGEAGCLGVAEKAGVAAGEVGCSGAGRIAGAVGCSGVAEKAGVAAGEVDCSGVAEKVGVAAGEVDCSGAAEKAGVAAEVGCSGVERIAEGEDCLDAAWAVVAAERGDCLDAENSGWAAVAAAGDCLDAVWAVVVAEKGGCLDAENSGWAVAAGEEGYLGEPERMAEAVVVAAKASESFGAVGADCWLEAEKAEVVVAVARWAWVAVEFAVVDCCSDEAARSAEAAGCWAAVAVVAAEPAWEGCSASVPAVESFEAVGWASMTEIVVRWGGDSAVGLVVAVVGPAAVSLPA